MLVRTLLTGNSWRMIGGLKMTFPLAQLAEAHRRDTERWIAQRDSIREARVARKDKKGAAAAPRDTWV